MRVMFLHQIILQVQSLKHYICVQRMKNIIFGITLSFVINLAQNSTHYYKQMYLPLFFRSPMPVHQWCSVTGQYTAASSEQSHQMSWWCQQWLPSWTPTGGDKCQCSQRRNHSFLRFVSTITSCLFMKPEVTFHLLFLADVPISQEDTVQFNHQSKIILFWQTATPELYHLC